MNRTFPSLFMVTSALAASTVLLILAPLARAQPSRALRFQGKPGETYAYEIDITAEADSYTETFKGVVSFKHTIVTPDQLKIVYNGGLNKSRKSKPQTGSRGGPPFGPFGPGMIPRPSFGFGPGGPFSRNPFMGTSKTTNELTVEPRGSIQSMKGDSQLPYLLGNVSVLMFEPLPEQALASWTVNSGVRITEEGNRDRMPFGPFTQQQPDKSTSGSEVFTFNIERTNGPLVVINKTYRLNSPATSANEARFEINGAGKWTFNQQLGISESLDFKQNLVVHKGNSEVTYPITIKYRRLTTDEWNRLETARIEAENKRRNEAKRLADAKKAAAEAPIEGDKRKEILTALASDNVPKIESALKTLQSKTVREDEEIAGAIKPLLEHPHASVREKSEAALARFSPDFKRIYDLNRAYNDQWPVEPSGPPVTDQTPLPAGLIVAARRHGKWHAAKVIQTLDDGNVQVQFQKWPWKDNRSRVDMRLAPPEVKQPDVDPSMVPGASTAAAGTPEHRTWTDDSGSFSIEAQYVGVDGTNVRLKLKADGREIKVPLDRLSPDDKKYVEQQQKAPKITNPFDQ